MTTAFARAWAQAVGGTSFVALSCDELDTLLSGFAGTIEDVLRSEPFCAEPAADVGAQLVAAGLVDVETLRRSIEVIGCELGRGPTDPRVVSEQAALASGYELVKEFEWDLGRYAWNAGHGSVALAEADILGAVDALFRWRG